MYEYVLHSHTHSAAEGGGVTGNDDSHVVYMTKFMSGSREVGGGGSEPTTTSPGKFELTQFT